jgi:hypothetical protein
MKYSSISSGENQESRQAKARSWSSGLAKPVDTVAGQPTYWG